MYIYGKNVVKEFINNKGKINRAYVYQDIREKDLIDTLSKICDIKYITRNELDKMVDGNHQGIVLSVDDYKYTSLSEITKDNDIIVILDHILDPHNLGAIIRTCEAAGITGIILPKDRSTDVNSTVIKTSAGTAQNVKIAQVTNLTSVINTLKKTGYWIIGADMNGTDYDTIDYKGKIVIVIGGEGTGLTRLVRSNCDFIASIPMQGHVNSLNASVASGIIIFEAIKKRR